MNPKNNTDIDNTATDPSAPSGLATQRCSPAYYWDCECDCNYIHDTNDREECPLCFAIMAEASESDPREVSFDSNHFLKPKSMEG